MTFAVMEKGNKRTILRSESMEAIKNAIKHFECVKSDAVAVLDSGFGTKPNESNITYKNRKLYAELAINALEKQIPMRVEYYDDGDYARCPNCDYEDFENGINDWECNFCSRCGQALDWSDKE